MEGLQSDKKEDKKDDDKKDDDDDEEEDKAIEMSNDFDGELSDPRKNGQHALMLETRITGCTGK